MGIIYFLGCAYLAVAAAAITLTLRERGATGPRGPLLCTLGVVACLFWPVAVLACLLSRRQRLA